MVNPEENNIHKVAELILSSRRLVVFTGAGVSTESGISDFRSPGGLWSRFDPEDFTISKFVSSPQTRKLVWHALVSEFMQEKVLPNPAHYAIAELDRLGKLDCVITQNVDNLHQRAGVPQDKVYELHGNNLFAICLGCRQRYPMERVRAGLKEDEVPTCPACQGILKPDAVFFGEALPERVLQAAIAHSQRADVMIVIGSTLLVYPAAYMPQYALDSGAKLVIINLSPTPLDRHAAIHIQGKAGEAMSKIVDKVKAKIGVGGGR